MIVVMGGMGSITGSVLAAFLVTVGQEWLRVLDGPINLGFFQSSGIAGMRMVVFSGLLLVVILFFRNGLMGTREFSWPGILRLLRSPLGQGKRVTKP